LGYAIVNNAPNMCDAAMKRIWLEVFAPDLKKWFEN
jgi:hypothetical protein